MRVLVTRRPKYACRTEEGDLKAPAPARLIEGSLPAGAPIAHVIAAKYADHLLLYRQGLKLHRSTMAAWIGRAVQLLKPLLEWLKSSEKLFAEKTTAPVLDFGRGCTKT